MHILYAYFSINGHIQKFDKNRYIFFKEQKVFDKYNEIWEKS